LPWKTFNDRDKIDIFGRALLDKVRSIPGIENAALSSNGPLMGGWQTGFWREGTPQPQPSQMWNADLEVVRGDYFATLKVPLLRGRTFNESDTKDAPRVIVVDQTLVDKYFPNEDPIGKRLAVDAGNDNENYVMSEIVGVVAPMRFHAIDEMAPLPVIYCSLGQAQRPSLTLFVRSALASAGVTRAIHQAVTSVNPSLPLFGVRPMSDRLRETWGTQRLLSVLFSVFAALALTLATIGLYGLLAYTTLKRVREIGIRLALGARPAQVRRMILSHGMQLLLVGAIIGFVSAIALSKFLQRLLFESNGANAEIYFGVGTVMLVATLLACWIPARRASRVDPIVALRQD
jgi:predicted permease